MSCAHDYLFDVFAYIRGVSKQRSDQRHSDPEAASSRDNLFPNEVQTNDAG